MSDDPLTSGDPPFRDDAEATASFERPIRSPAQEATVDRPAGETTTSWERSGEVGSPPADRRFGDYELIREIARGGMGVVYQARHLRLNRLVALKMILSGEFAGQDEVARFFREAEAAANLDHPGIVPIYEIGVQDGRHFYAMAFVDGRSLAARIAAGPLPPREAAELAHRVATAVQYAHDRGVVHRDLKPANVLLDAAGMPRVSDFGLAKRLHGASDLTGSGQVLGTPSYMPPEQAAGDVERVGPLADVYSLGAILYCMIVGRPPFQSANPIDTLMQVLHDEPVAPRKLDRKIPRDLETICLKCLEKRPDNRYRSAHALADDLQRFLDGDPPLARPLGPVSRLRRWTKRRPIATGCSVATLGLAFSAAGLATGATAITFFSTAGFMTFENLSEPAATVRLEGSTGGETGVLKATPDGLHELYLSADLVTAEYEDKAMFQMPDDSSWPDESPDLESAPPNVTPHYNLPVSYAVTDSEGATIDEGKSRLVWNGSLRRMSIESLDESTGELRFRTSGSIVRFRAPPSGAFEARVELGTDEEYGSRVEGAEVQLFENVQDTRGAVTAGGAFCVATPILALLGLALTLAGPALVAFRSQKT